MTRHALSVLTMVVALLGFPAGMVNAGEKVAAEEAARSVCEELEPLLAQAPARQVEWARRWAAVQVQARAGRYATCGSSRKRRLSRVSSAIRR